MSYSEKSCSPMSSDARVIARGHDGRRCWLWCCQTSGSGEFDGQAFKLQGLARYEHSKTTFPNG